MCDIRQSKRVSIWIAILAVLPLLTACGGGDESPSTGPSVGNSNNPPLICLLYYILFNGECVPDPDNPPPASEPPPPAETPPGSLIMNVISDLEPNDDLSIAHPASIPSRTTPEQRVGFFVFGSINDMSDTIDAFAFTAAESRTFQFNLCPPGDGSTCPTMGLDVFTAFFRILDQDGNVLLTTQADELQGNRRALMIDAGVLYYLTILAGDTMTADVEYKLSAFEHPK